MLMFPIYCYRDLWFLCHHQPCNCYNHFFSVGFVKILSKKASKIANSYKLSHDYILYNLRFKTKQQQW